jgi:hypothetical protein
MKLQSLAHPIIIKLGYLDSQAAIQWGGGGGGGGTQIKNHKIIPCGTWKQNGVIAVMQQFYGLQE